MRGRGRSRNALLPRPGLSVDLSGGVLPASLVFSRASAAGFMDSDGVYKSVATGEPRFVTGEGVLIEAGSTNYITYARDLTQAVWVKTDATATLDQVGIDGAANSATRLKADADGAMALFSHTGTPTAWNFSVYLGRITGTGVVSLTKDGGATWDDVTIPASGVVRFSVVPSGANPVVGIRLATEGDEILVDGAQLEYIGNSRVILPTSAIFTAGSTVARASDVLTVDTTDIDLSAFSLCVEHKATVDVYTGYPQALTVSDGTTDNCFFVAEYSYLSDIWQCEVKVAGSNVASTYLAAYPAAFGVFSKNAVTLATGRAVHASGGRLKSAGIRAPASIPSCNAIQFNTLGDGSYGGCMVLKRFQLWTVPLHDEQLRRATI